MFVCSAIGARHADRTARSAMRERPRRTRRNSAERRRQVGGLAAGFAFRDLDGLFAYFETVMMGILYFHSTNTYINFYVLKLVKSLSRLIF